MGEEGKARQGSPVIWAAVILGFCIIVASLIGRPSQTGRYQVGGVSGHLCVIDTTTGEVWETWVTEHSSEFRDFTKRK